MKCSCKHTRKMIQLFLCLLLTFLPVFILVSCGQEGSSVESDESLPEAKTKTSFAFDTVVSITYYYDENADAVQEAMDSLSYYENIFSRTLETSELYRLNEAISKGENFYASMELYECIQNALEIARISHGAFDITLGKITALWDFEAENPRIPADSEIQKYLPYVGYEHLSLEIEEVPTEESDSSGGEDETKIRFRISSDEPNLAIDLGGVAKGYIEDQVYVNLYDAGVTSAILNFGGNIITMGTKPDNTEFTIGIQKPEKGSAEYVSTYPIRDHAMVTSGNYERYFEKDGVRYHHILDPKTGYPVQNDLASATIIGIDGGTCDALSTAVYVLGADNSMDIVDLYTNYQFIFLDKNLILTEMNQ